jgi:hypothetical protein
MSIEAMKQALKTAYRLGQEYWYQADHAFVSQNKKADATKAKFDKLVEETCQAIEQAEKQEPFGYLWPTGRHPEFRFTQQLRDGVEGTPVYTTPQPQREWVGLTDEEVKHMLELFVVPPHHVEMVVKAIEAKLKEKNT